MAPWPDRVDSYSQSRRPIDSSVPAQSNAIFPLPTLGPRPVRSNNVPRPRDYDTTNNGRLEPTSRSPEDNLQPSRPARPPHSRSMSHPFPSLFSINKKKTKPRVENSSSDSESGEGQMPRLNKSNANVRAHRPGTSKDFTTGHCMTCDSLVRWPRELHLFKCTICLTINDLQPNVGDPRKEGGQKTQQTGRGRSGSFRPPISVGHAKTLVTECLRSYLRAALTDPSPNYSHDRSTLPTSQSPRDLIKNRLQVPSASHPTTSTPSSPSPEHMSLSNLSPERGPHPDPVRKSTMPRSYSTSYPERRPCLEELSRGDEAPSPQRQASPNTEAKQMFKPLEVYVTGAFTSFQHLNTSFSTPGLATRGSAHRPQTSQPEPRKDYYDDGYPLVDLDPKLLLLGTVAENGAWWSGHQEEKRPARTASSRNHEGSSSGTLRTPHIDWEELDEWYMTVIEAARSWPQVYDELVQEDVSLATTDSRLWELEAHFLTAQQHVQRTLLKATETILKRPGQPISGPHELRFLLIIAENPLLHSTKGFFHGRYDHPEVPHDSSTYSQGNGPTSGKHSGIIKRILGLIANSSTECRSHLEVWLSKYPHSRFVRFKDLVNGFLNYRLIREHDKEYAVKVDVTAGLIPSMLMGRSPASLHAALEQSDPAVRAPGLGSTKKQKESPKKTKYQENWQIKAAAKVMALLFEANNMGCSRSSAPVHPENLEGGLKEGVQARGQILATSDFYLTLLDDSDLIADFEAWEQRRGKFSFCQFPFLLSIWAKIQILEYDAKRQMQNKARDAFFDSILSNRKVDQYFIIKVRRDCLVDDSLQTVSQVSSSIDDIKKGLRVIFQGEEGVDAGGLRKEWFLLLIRELFNPDYGMFTYDEDSQYCYFNPNSFESSERFRLVGIVFGLAIYNSTILDVAFPPFAFRKLLRAAPATPTNPQNRPAMTYTLDDLAEYRPRLAKGLRDLLDYEGDVETTFCLNFTITIDKYGAHEAISLCTNGHNRPVTNGNRREYVDLYVRYLLDTAVTRQFEPFRRGFFMVCGGNALSLFRPEEIELLVRGSDEALDIGSLQVAAQYENWGVADPARREPTVMWFWDSFEKASPRDQRKLLSFITGSDRIPAMGAASLTIRISCLGEDCGRYPLARTCFNMLSLARYHSRQKFETTMWRAVKESEGFGLK